MKTTTSDMKKDAKELLYDKTWKGPLAMGIVAIVLAIILNSALFDLLKWLILTVLYIGGIILLGLSAYRWYQMSESKK